MADLATLKTWLTEAEAARHKLMTGTLEVTVGYGDARVTYGEADKAALDAYIADLENQIAALEVAADSTSRPARTARKAHVRNQS